MIALGHGLYLETSEELKQQQKDWHDEDDGKNIDFDLYPLWLTTDDGQMPQGFHSIDECKKELEQ